MAINTGDSLPADENQWNGWRDTYQVSSLTIHDAALTSTFTIREKQYLLPQDLQIGSGI